jgi:ATP:ADP antiporter, AAA family
VAHLQPERRGRATIRTTPDAPPGGHERASSAAAPGRASKRCFRSPYLLGIAGYVLILAIMATFIYFTRLQMVAALGDDLDMRTGVRAIDLITQITTLCCRLWSPAT